MKTYICLYFGAAAIALLATPLVARFARRMGLIDQPGVRKVHKSPVPRIGGVAIYCALMAMILAVFALDNRIGNALGRIRFQMLTLLAASTFVFLVGFADDVRSLPARLKFLALIA